MIPRYAVRTIMLASSERLPVLLNRTTGQPLFEPTVYSVSALRSENKASNSIDAALRAIMVLQVFLDLQNIDLNRRLREGVILGLGEIEELVRLCRLPLTKLSDLLATGGVTNVAPVRIASIEKHRMKQSAPEKSRDVTSARSRVRYIRDYLKWLVEIRLSQHGLDPQLSVALTSAGARTTDALNTRIPESRGRNTIGGREGIGQEAADMLLAVIAPDSPDNPWHGDFAKKRNQLVIHWLYELGIRRGELLGIEINDINFANNTVTIARKADSTRDPRRRQPLTKTLDRVLPITERLAQMTKDYVIGVRNGKKKGLRHGFLIVAAGTGAPLSLIGLSKVFEVLRTKCPTLPEELTPHVLRHTVNDLFSKKMDATNVSEIEEEKWRSELMGWKPGSGTASTYTKRHVREKAGEASLGLQGDIGKGLKNDK